MQHIMFCPSPTWVCKLRGMCVCVYVCVVFLAHRAPCVAGAPAFETPFCAFARRDSTSRHGYMLLGPSRGSATAPRRCKM